MSTWHLLRRHLSLRNIPLTICIVALRGFSFVPVPVIYILGSCIGEVLFWLYPSRRRITLINLAKCFPALPRKKHYRLARAHFRTLTIGAMTMPVAWWASPGRMQRICVYRNKQILDDKLQAGKNLIFLAPHFAGLEFLGMLLFSRLQMSSMYQKHKNPLMDEFMLQRRSRFGNKLYGNKSSLISLIKSIKSGIPFYYLPDQDPGKSRGVFAPFFGIEAATFNTLSRIAKQSDAAVIPCMAKLSRFGRGYEIIFAEELKPFPSGNDIEDVTTMNKAIEKLILNAPEQYFWSHKRFKTRPEGQESFY